MRVFKKLFLPFDDESGRIDPDVMREALESTVGAEEIECVPYDPSKHDDVEMVWMTDGARELTWEDKLKAKVVQLKPRK